MTRTHQTRQTQSTTFPLSSGLLQRKCATCGQHMVAGDKCPDCEQEESSLQRQVDTATPGFETPDPPSIPMGTLSRVSGTTIPATIQPKLTVGAPGDKYEEEADRVADEIMRMPDPLLTPTASQNPPAIQKVSNPSSDNSAIENDDEEEREPLQPKRLNTPQSPEATVQRAEMPDADLEEEEELVEPIQTKPLLQRKPNESKAKDEEKEDEDDKHNKVHPKTQSGSVPEVTPSFEARLKASQEQGQPLDDKTLRFMEPRFDTSFKDVKVHTDNQAAQLNREIGAQAFTHQEAIYLGANHQDMGLLENNRLLAHELTHVVQQRESDLANISARERKKSPGMSTLLSNSECNEIHRKEVCKEEDLYDSNKIEQDKSYPEKVEKHQSEKFSKPPETVTRENLRIIATPEKHPEILGRTISYRVASFVKARRVTVPEAWEYRVIGPWEVIRPDRIKEKKGKDYHLEITLDQIGKWIIRTKVELKEDNFYDLEYQHDIISSSKLASHQLGQLDQLEFLKFRAQLEIEKLKACHYTEWAKTNENKKNPYISCDDPNPAAQTNYRDKVYHTYKMHPSQGISRFRWYVRSTNPEKIDYLSYMPATFGSASFSDEKRTSPSIAFVPKDIDGIPALVRSGYNSENSTYFTFVVCSSGTYIISCDELDEQGNLTGNSARYVQVVLPKEEYHALESIKKHVKRVDEKIKKIRKESEIPLKASYVNHESGQSITLSFYLGPSESDESTFVLLDLTPGIKEDEVVYVGASVQEVLDNFEGQNSYPEGIIALEVPPNHINVNPLRRQFETTGSSTWSEWSSGTGWASLGLVVLGGIAAVIPGGQVFAGWCFVGAAALGGVSYGFSLYDRLQKAEVEPKDIAIDVIGIASSILGGASAFRAVRHGASVALATPTGRYLLWTGFSTDLASGVLLTVEGFDEIDQIIDSDLPRGEQIAAIVRTLANLALQGGLVMLSVKDLKKTKLRLAESMGEQNIGQLKDDLILTLNLLDEDILKSFQNLSVDQLKDVARLIRKSPEAADRLIRAFGPNIGTSSFDTISDWNWETLFKNRRERLAHSQGMLATGRTDIPGLEGKSYEGASTRAGGPRLKGKSNQPTNPQGPTIQFGGRGKPHAEGDVINQMIIDIENSFATGKLREADLRGKSIFIAVEQNPCPNCAERGHRDLLDKKVKSNKNILGKEQTGWMSALIQASYWYSETTIRITFPGGRLTFRGGKIIERIGIPNRSNIP